MFVNTATQVQAGKVSRLTKLSVLHTIKAHSVPANIAAVYCICWLITSIVSQLCVGIASVRPIYHGIDSELSLAGPVYSIGNRII